VAAAPALPERRDLSGSGVTVGGPRGSGRAAAAICLGAGALRMLIAATTPLFPDETYYWEWSRRLAAGYFDHPPAVAWITAAGTALAGDTPLGVRLGSVILGIVASLALAAAARRVAGEDAGVLTAAVFAVMPLSAAGLVLATPDAPLFAAACFVWYALLRALEHPAGTRASLAWWCAAGVALGVAFASKYTSVLIPFGILIACVAHAPLRRRLREPGPYAAVGIAVVVFLPVLVWNARHGWLSLAFQLGHGLSRSSGSIISRELEMIGGQAGLVSPVLFFMIGLTVWRALRARSTAALEQLLATAALVTFAFFMYSATKRRVEANWPALAYLPAIVLVSSVRASSWRRDTSSRLGLGLAAALTIVAYVNAYVPVLPVPARRDPAARAVGWDAIARAADAATLRSSAHVHVAADRYQDASELAFHLPGHPTTFALNLGGRPNQYDLWPGFPETARPGDDLVLMLDDTPQVPAQILTLAPHFTTVARGDSARLERHGDLVKQFRLWTLRGWRGTWPQAELRSRP
jgi:4-amino-4-deoxy-L-arabinose transferase-like glycosyltransferase